MKLQEQVMKLYEHILNIIREVSIDEMWFGLMSGKGTTNAIFLFCKLQDKYMKKKEKYMLCFCRHRQGFHLHATLCLVVGYEKIENKRVGYPICKIHLQQCM